MTFLTKALCILIVLFTTSIRAEKVLLVLDKRFCGEYSFANKVVLACKNLNWDAVIIDYADKSSVESKNFDLAICLTPGDYSQLECSKFLALFLPDRNYFNESGQFLPEYDNFNGYLLSFDPNSYENLKKYFITNKTRPYLYWLPTSSTTPHVADKFSKIFWIEARWGDRVDDKKYKDLFKQLTRSKMIDSWGPSYNKLIPFEGDDIFSLMAADGISLVIHSNVHKDFGIPTGRIFEAMTVGNIIISDFHPFVVRELGENALYVDYSKSIESIKNQIYLHLKWIDRNRQEAASKAKKSHEIFLEKYTLEKQLINLFDLNKKLKKEKE